MKILLIIIIIALTLSIGLKQLTNGPVDSSEGDSASAKNEKSEELIPYNRIEAKVDVAMEMPIQSARTTTGVILQKLELGSEGLTLIGKNIDLRWNTAMFEAIGAKHPGYQEDLVLGSAAEAIDHFRSLVPYTSELDEPNEATMYCEDEDYFYFSGVGRGPVYDYSLGTRIKKIGGEFLWLYPTFAKRI